MSNSKSTNKPSEWISLPSAFSIIYSAVYAFCIGQPLNRRIIIHCKKGNLSLLLKYMSDWLRFKTGVAATWIYVWECPDGLLHVNILIHVPDKHLLRFNQKSRTWVTACGFKWAKKEIFSEPLYYSKTNDPCSYLCMGLRGVLQYTLKGVDSKTAALLGIAHKTWYKPQGLVPFKRCGRSENLHLRFTPITNYRGYSNIYCFGTDRRLLQLVRYAWGDQQTGEYVHDVHFPVPNPE